MLGLPTELREISGELTPESVVTRYPDIAGGMPAKLYGKNRAERVLKSAGRLLPWLLKRVK
ncbi:MAG: HEPN domain-containing protein [Candidatus Aenigmarchaeota archaeon]|nr:HEPN domain-containing protein [Candidatus Aenigmarchaeota archaeon]